MKKFRVLSFLSVIAMFAFTIALLHSAGFAQNRQISSQKPVKLSARGGLLKANESNANVPEKRKCGTMEYLQWKMQQDPTLKEKMEQERIKLQKWIEENQDFLNNNKTVYTIPVVVHIILSNPNTITDAEVQGQIDVLNEDFRALNSDISDVPSAFQGVIGDCQIEFCLATVDPSGNPTTGIERRTNSETFGLDDQIKFNSQGGLDAWDPQKYLNIWVGNLSGGLLGYADFPPVSNTYGAVINYNAFGVPGGNPPYNLGRTATHEIGHCFTLFHIWGDDNGACTGTDYCADTPNQANANSGCPNFPHTDACSPSSPGVMFMNFMDYVNDACMVMFSDCQAQRVQAAVQNYLMSLVNNASTVCNLGPVAPTAAFTWIPTSPVVNTSVQFTDQSTGNPTSWNWTFGDGGTANTQNPTHTYTSTGTFNVCLTVTNTAGSNQTCHSLTVTPIPTQCDTFSNVDATDSLATYIAMCTTNVYGGYASGNNCYEDLAKADYFSQSQLTGMDYITGAHFCLAQATGTGPDIKFSVWGETNGQPGTELGFEQFPLSSIVTSYNNGNNPWYYVDFDPNIALPASGGIFVGVNLPPNSSDDTIALVTNSDDYTIPTTAWEKWEDNSWHSYNDGTNATWQLDVSHLIFIALCPEETDVNAHNALAQQIHVFPNPANEYIILRITNLYEYTNYELKIYDVLGREMPFDFIRNSSGFVISTSNLTAGIYYLNIQTDKTVVTKKVTLIK